MCSRRHRAWSRRLSLAPLISFSSHKPEHTMTDTPKPPFPTPHEANHLEYVGIISSAWAQLEFIIDGTTWRLGGIEPNVGGCLSANLGSIHLKLRSLYALLELNNASKETLKKFRDFQNRISGTADKRNRVVHHPWLPIVSPQGTQIGQFIIRAGSKGREFGTKPIPLSAQNPLGRPL